MSTIQAKADAELPHQFNNLQSVPVAVATQVSGASEKAEAKAPAKKLKILLDLKPALDGYAGIPQETRLLFRGLRMMDDVDVEGLIQHGSRRLRSAVPPKGKILSSSKRINRLSRVIVSLNENPYSSMLDTMVEGVQRYFALSLLRMRVIAGGSLTPGVFDSNLFDDFIWRSFFSKTLKPCDKELVTSAQYRILRTPKKHLHHVGLSGLRYSSTPRYAKIDTRGFDVFLAQTPFPARVSPGTSMVVRYHDAVPVLMPHTINDKAFHQASHFYALQQNVRAGAWFSCISEATRSDLLKIFPEAEPKTSVIHNIVSNEYFDDQSPKGLVLQIVRNRLAKTDAFKTDMRSVRFDDSKDNSGDFDYLLMVSTLEPRKNHMMLMGAWERLKYTSMPKLKLVIVGNIGWDHAPILDAFRPWAERGDLFYLNNVPSSELRGLYKHASATICPSLAEGFDYSGIEAMRSGGIAISSDIPVHREIYGDASVYFNPYSTEDAASVIHSVLAPSGKMMRARLHAEGVRVSDRYTSRNILPKWEEFFDMLQRSSAARKSR
jgi:glycosyltransferase involved in cell wall biosynthesis